jgi:hypothetical protein
VEDKSEVAPAERDGINNPLCENHESWVKKQDEVKKSFAAFTPDAQRSLAICHLQEIPEQSKKAYDDLIHSKRNTYCVKRKRAFDAAEKAARAGVEGSSGQLCSPLSKNLGVIQSARAELESLQKEIEKDLHYNVKDLDTIEAEQNKRINACPKLLEETRDCQNLIDAESQARLTGGGVSRAAAVRDNPNNPCNQDKKKLELVAKDVKKFWSEEAPVKNRLTLFKQEVEGLKVKIAKLQSTESAYQTRLAHEKCEGSTAKTNNGPGGGGTPGSPAAAAPSSGIKSAGDMAKCYEGGCSSEDVKNQQRQINEYIKKNNLPIAPIAEDGIAGVQTANAWRAATMYQTHRSSTEYAQPESVATQPSRWSSTYQSWDASATKNSDGYIDFKKGKASADLIKMLILDSRNDFGI